jgi:hypothetical protein
MPPSNFGSGYYPLPPEDDEEMATSYHGTQHHPAVMNQLLEAALPESSRSMPPTTDVYGNAAPPKDDAGDEEEGVLDGMKAAEKLRKKAAESEWIWTKAGAEYMDEVWGMQAKQDGPCDEDAIACLESNVKNGMEGAQKAGYIKSRFQREDNEHKDFIAEDMKQFYGTLARPKAYEMKGKQYLIFQPLILIQCIFNPLGLFLLAFVINTQARYRLLYVALLLDFILIVSVMFMNLSRYTKDTKEREKRLYKFMLMSNLMGCCVGTILGEATYQANFKPYFDLANLAHYPKCDPSVHKAQMFSDAGQIDFFYGTHLDLARSHGFKSGDTYCVAPIVGPETGGWLDGIMPKLPNYDFWAVGINCCSGHAPDFHCGEWSNWRASSGLRLTRDDLRDYFKLAVQGAEAEHNIQSAEPFFVYLMSNPRAEIDSYWTDGWAEMVHATVGMLFIQAMVTGAVGLLCIDNA